MLCGGGGNRVGRALVGRVLVCGSSRRECQGNPVAGPYSVLRRTKVSRRAGLIPSVVRRRAGRDGCEWQPERLLAPGVGFRAGLCGRYVCGGPVQRRSVAVNPLAGLPRCAGDSGLYRLEGDRGALAPRIPALAWTGWGERRGR